MAAYLQVDHLSKTFVRGSQETEVLQDITLMIEKGEYVSIIGHSGCGKSTLLNIVAGLVPCTTGGATGAADAAADIAAMPRSTIS